MTRLLYGLSVLFLVLELVDVIDWPWYAVLTPVFCWLGLLMVVHGLKR